MLRYEKFKFCQIGEKDTGKSQKYSSPFIIQSLLFQDCQKY